jgi:hypothetical protein
MPGSDVSQIGASDDLTGWVVRIGDDHQVAGIHGLVDDLGRMRGRPVPEDLGVREGPAELGVGRPGEAGPHAAEVLRE